MYYVYKYIDKNEKLLYVGQTVDLDRRFGEHKGRIWDIEKEKILFAKCKTCADMNLYEMYYINKLRPLYNDALVYRDEPTFELPELEWVEYDKNHFEKEKKVRDEAFKESLKSRFSPDVFWANKIIELEKRFQEETDFVKKKNILIEIRNCKTKIRPQ